MIAVVQRVARARVTVEERETGAIGRGLLVLVGVRKGDPDGDAALLARKLAEFRVFPDEQGRMNRSCLDLGLPLLVVSQFTLCADLRRGRRPGFDLAAEPAVARARIQDLVAGLCALGLRVEEGEFGAEMAVELLNEGPATFVLDAALWRK